MCTLTDCFFPEHAEGASLSLSYFLEDIYDHSYLFFEVTFHKMKKTVK